MEKGGSCERGCSHHEQVKQENEQCVCVVDVLTAAVVMLSRMPLGQAYYTAVYGRLGSLQVPPQPPLGHTAHNDQQLRKMAQTR